MGLTMGLGVHSLVQLGNESNCGSQTGARYIRGCKPAETSEVSVCPTAVEWAMLKGSRRS